MPSVANGRSYGTADRGSQTRLVYAKPANPAQAGAEADNDFDSSLAQAKAYAGMALAVMAKFHSDLMNIRIVVPFEPEIAATFAEGAMAIQMGVECVDALTGYRDDEVAELRAEVRALRTENEVQRVENAALKEAARKAPKKGGSR